MKRNIIATVGMCGSGKSILGKYLVEKGLEKIYFGGITIEEVKRRNLEVNEKNERFVREELRKEHGMGAFATLSLPGIERSLKKGRRVLIDGLYSFSEYKILRENFGDSLLIIAVFTPKELRYERLADRKVRPLTKQEAVSRDFSEIENIEKGGPIAMADYTVINDSTINSMISHLEEILKKEEISL